MWNLAGVATSGERWPGPSSNHCRCDVVNDSIGEVPIVVFSAVEGPTGAAYVALVENATMTFSFVDGRFRDDQTNSTWNLAGVATSGELAGTQLQPLPMRSTLWFSLVTSFPDIELYRER